jgi:hypothetical protein
MSIEPAKESPYATVKRTWDVGVKAKEIKKALETLVAAAHGKNAENIHEATEVVKKNLIKDDGIINLMIAASDWRARNG